MRRLELIAIILFAFIFLYSSVETWLTTDLSFALAASALVGGLLLADLISGLVHWFADTWGSVRWKILGPTLIRGFREHHVDAAAMSNHDFVETNGATALVLLPALIVLNCMPGHLLSEVFFLKVAGLSLLFWLFLTNQIHKWAHSVKRPRVITVLQTYSLILSPSHHLKHHREDLNSNYCITCGWLNYFLDRAGAFRFLETMINRLTGAIPRAEDKNFVEQVGRVESV